MGSKGTTVSSLQRAVLDYNIISFLHADFRHTAIQLPNVSSTMILIGIAAAQDRSSTIWQFGTRIRTPFVQIPCGRRCCTVAAIPNTAAASSSRPRSKVAFSIPPPNSRKGLPHNQSINPFPLTRPIPGVLCFAFPQTRDGRRVRTGQGGGKDEPSLPPSLLSLSCHCLST